MNTSIIESAEMSKDILTNLSTNFSGIFQKSDHELHEKFVKLGADRRKLTNELLHLLPEIFEKEIYKKYYATIVEYAGKFGGLSKGVVLKRLRLEKYLKDKPILREAIRTEGIHKIALVAPLVTLDSEKAWVDKVKNMSKNALQELSKEMRNNLTPGVGLFAHAENQTLTPGVKKLCQAVPLKIMIKLDSEMTFKFLKLKKRFGKNLNNKQVMEKIFEEAENKMSTKKEQAVADKTEIDDKKVNTKKEDGMKKVILEDTFQNPSKNIPTRYVSAGKSKTALKKTGGKCSYPGCNRPADVLHHSERFAANRSHESIKPLCKIHHEFAHNGLIAYETHDEKNWQLNIQNTNLNIFDIFYRKKRQEKI